MWNYRLSDQYWPWEAHKYSLVCCATTLHFYYLQSIYYHCKASVSPSVSSHVVSAFAAFSIDPQPEWEQNEDEPVTGWDSYRLTPVCCCWCWMTTDMEIRKNGLRNWQNEAIERVRFNLVHGCLFVFYRFKGWPKTLNSQQIGWFHW